MARGALEAFEGDLEDEAGVLVGGDGADWAEAVDRVVADVFIERGELFVGESEIGFSYRRQFFAFSPILSL